MSNGFVIDVRLFLVLFLLELVFIVLGYIGLIFFIFFYFGSGMGASSPQAMCTQRVWIAALFLLPFSFGLLKYLRTSDKARANSYLLMAILCAMGYVVGFII